MSGLRLATRGSPLALAQARRVAAALEAAGGQQAEIVVVETSGDRRSTEPLREIGGQGIFAKEVQQALLDGAADLAVHSAKDLPAIHPRGLGLACVPERLDVADVLVGRSLSGLGPGATVATGSPRRQALLAELRPDLSFVELRGNMATRLAKPGSDGVDAVVAAAAALERLGELELVAERLDPERFVPQVGQGAIAVEAVVGSEAEQLAAAIDDLDAHRAISAERSFLAALGAGCSVPIGAWCRVEGDGLRILAIKVDEATGQLRRAELSGAEPVELGRRAAEAVSA